jgi:hypothetical protein
MTSNANHLRVDRKGTCNAESEKCNTLDTVAKKVATKPMFSSPKQQAETSSRRSVSIVDSKQTPRQIVSKTPASADHTDYFFYI